MDSCRHDIEAYSFLLGRYIRRKVFSPVTVHHQGSSSSANLRTTFDIHMSVHRNLITNYSQQDATFLEFIFFLQTLYVFHAVPPPIIRSTQLYIQLQVLSTIDNI